MSSNTSKAKSSSSRKQARKPSSVQALALSKCYFTIKYEPVIYHIGITVSVLTEPFTPEEGKSNMFHVVDRPTSEDTKQGMARLVFEELVDIRPVKAKTFYKAVKIGTLLSSDLGKLRSICEKMPLVYAPDTTLLPNCVTWIDNVLYEVNKAGFVSFSPTFSVPKQKKSLIVSKTSSKPKAGKAGPSTTRKSEY